MLQHWQMATFWVGAATCGSSGAVQILMVLVRSEGTTAATGRVAPYTGVMASTRHRTMRRWHDGIRRRR